MTHTTNYADTFITVSPDTAVTRGEEPAKPDSVAGMQYALIAAKPYGYTSDQVLFEVYARRHGIARSERAASRAAFFAKSQACLRASPLVKKHGWGIHHDEKGRIAAYGMETAAYRKFASRNDLKVVNGMRASRKA